MAEHIVPFERNEETKGTRRDGWGWNLRSNWRGNGWAFLATGIFVVIALVCFTNFVQWVETRPGVVLDDPLLNVLPPTDMTWPIFTVIYGGLLVGFISLVNTPHPFLHLLRAYGLLLFIRIAAMYVTPFAPPEGMIILADPVAGLGPGGGLQNDLFFSGHTATMFLLTLAVRPTRLKLLFGLMTFLLALMLLFQHVHYTVDVLAAPFFAWTCYRLTDRS